jgi:sorbitol-specific phosphotransferase system component IIA
MYIKKDYLNSIGMKVPLEYEDNINRTFKKVGINELIESCMLKKMSALKTDIYEYRYKKF